MAGMSTKGGTYYRDYLYLLIILVHMHGMFGIDFVSYYPDSLCRSPGAPLPWLTAYREWYLRTMSDPYYNMETSYYNKETPGHFFDFMIHVELVVQFPLAVYLVWNSLTRRWRSSADELAGVIYGITTGLCTAVICYDMWHLGPQVIEPQARWVLLYPTYLPFAVVPGLMALDMSFRLLSRLDVSEKSKRQ